MIALFFHENDGNSPIQKLNVPEDGLPSLPVVGDLITFQNTHPENAPRHYCIIQRHFSYRQKIEAVPDKILFLVREVGREETERLVFGENW